MKLLTQPEPEVAELYNEYLFCSTFHVSHEQYLDTPRDTVLWMLKLEETVRVAENDAAKREAKRGQRNQGRRH
jgi:hypothetical protein